MDVGSESERSARELILFCARGSEMAPNIPPRPPCFGAVGLKRPVPSTKRRFARLSRARARARAREIKVAGAARRISAGALIIGNRSRVSTCRVSTGRKARKCRSSAPSGRVTPEFSM